MIKEGTKIDWDTFSLGTAVVKFNLPIEFVDAINKAYDENSKNLKPHNDQLAGKIAEENALDEFLDDDIKKMFMWCFRQYLKISDSNDWDPFLKQVWVNEMRANEYNPIHFHTSKDTGVGLSSVRRRSIKSRRTCKWMVIVRWRRPITTFCVECKCRCSSWGLLCISIHFTTRCISV